MTEQHELKPCEQWEPALHDYMEGLLPMELAERVEEHLTACEGCRRLMAEWERVGQMLAELPVLPAPVGYIKIALPERRPLFQSSQVAALWVGMALPGAWVLQSLASAFHWERLLPTAWTLPILNHSSWLEAIRSWVERLIS